MIKQFTRLSLTTALAFSHALSAHEFTIGLELGYTKKDHGYTDGIPSYILNNIDDKWQGNDVWTQSPANYGEGIGSFNLSAEYTHKNWITRISLPSKKTDSLSEEYKIGTAAGTDDWSHITAVYSTKRRSFDLGYKFLVSKNITITPFAGIEFLSLSTDVDGHDHVSTKDECGLFLNWTCKDNETALNNEETRETEKFKYIHGGIALDAKYSKRNTITIEYAAKFNEYRKYKVEHVTAIGSMINPVYKLSVGYESTSFKDAYGITEDRAFLGIDVSF